MLHLNAVSPSLDRAQGRGFEALKARVEHARSVFRQQAEAIAALAHRLDARFDRAVELMHATPGHVVISGMGKSGIIGQKIAATLASTGTPSFFVHPGDAYHGDLGMITAQNTVVLLSYSGETEEVTRLLPHLKRMRIPVIGLVGRMESTLAQQVDVALDVSVAQEVCPNNLAPTNSTLAALAMGDALAVALIRERSFGPHDFARFHPGGSLGRKLCSRVADLMLTESLSLLGPEDSVRDAVLALARGALGLAIVVDAAGRPMGVISEDDIRRALDASDAPLAAPVTAIMRTEVPVIEAGARIADAEERALVLDAGILVAVDESGEVVGVLDLRSSLGEHPGTRRVKSVENRLENRLEKR